MEPTVNQPNITPESTPKPSGPEITPASEPAAERTAPSPEKGAETAPVSSPSPVPAPVLPKVSPPPPLPAAHDTSATAVSMPAIADDVDVIEMEWVNKAKEIIKKTKDDPHAQEREVERLQRDYLKKRYGKDIKAANT